MDKLQRLRKTAYNYYFRKDVQAALAEQAQNKETIPFYFDTFGKRPDIIEYPQDIANLAAKGATSFHASEETWQNPLEINTNLKIEQLNKLRIGWDLILDIDCKFIEYSKITAWLLCEALYFHGVRNFGLKFSGGSGFHLGLKFGAFPEKINEIKIRNFFPEGPRLIANYLKDMIKNDLAKRILEINNIKDISKSTGKSIGALIDKEKKFNPYSILEIDTVLIAPRHLYRMAYSLHEKTRLASVVIKPGQLKEFHPAWAKPERVFVKPFMPEPEKNEAKELLIQAMDWKARQNAKKHREETEEKKKNYDHKTRIKITKLSTNMFPPCIKSILGGMKQDGRKRALFILINFFRSLGLEFETIEPKLKEWNKLNYRPLKENYVATQIQWFKKQEPRLPPNCSLSAYYLDLAICQPDFLCKKIKNPVSYVTRKARIIERAEQTEKRNQKRRKKYSRKRK